MRSDIERKFIDNTVERYTEWCKSNGEEPDPVRFLQWLVKKKIVPQEEVKIGFVVTEVNNLSYCRGISKTAAIREVEAEYSIPESTQFYIMREHQQRHK